MIAAYLVLVELVEGALLRSAGAAEAARPSDEQRGHRHVSKRARRFTVHGGPVRLTGKP